jgi:Transglutaminase-like superfamily
MRRSPEREMLVLAAREPSPQRDHALAVAVVAVADWRAVLAEERRRLTLLASATMRKSAFLFGTLERVPERLSARGVAPLALYYVATRAGYPVRIAVGVRRVPASRGVTGHNWLELDGVPFHEPGAHPERTFVVMHRLPTA